MKRNLWFLTIALAAAAIAGSATFCPAQDQDLFDRTDANHDGYITRDELDRPKLFERLDTDKDGRISRQEAQSSGRTRRGGRRADQSEELPKPAEANVKYGAYERNVFDFWKAQSEKPVPLIVFIHGGGFRVGDKSQVSAAVVKKALASGVSVMAINYRFLPQTPVQDILRDCARAVQYVRANAAKFNIDPARIGCFGGSAGAGTSLWLATHDDLADPKSDDPVLRESSRISAAACVNGQATYDLVEWEKIIYPFKPEWRAHENEAAEFYGLKDEQELMSERGRRVAADCSMYSLLSKDDAPIWMSCSLPGGEPTDRNHLLHHPKHCEVIKKRGDEVGAKVEIHLRENNQPWLAAVEFLIRELGARSN